jgi:hypothetical protein
MMEEYKDDDLVVVENLGNRRGIGNYIFKKDPGYQYPVVKVPYKVIRQILYSIEQDKIADKARRKKLEEENRRIREVNKTKSPMNRISLNKIPDEYSKDVLRIGIPLPEKVDGRRKKVVVEEE